MTPPSPAGETIKPRRHYFQHEHHPLCNFFGTEGPCNMCDGFFADPKYADWNYENVDAKIAEHFPKAVKL